MISPTINCQVRDVFSVPVLQDIFENEEISRLVESNIELMRDDWDSFETSWDFEIHPLVRLMSFYKMERESDAKQKIVDMNYIKEAFTNWSNECYFRFQKLKENDESLNRIFIEIYGLENELIVDVEEKDVADRKSVV